MACTLPPDVPRERGCAFRPSGGLRAAWMAAALWGISWGGVSLADPALDVAQAVLRGDFSQARMLLERAATGGDPGKIAGLRRSLLGIEKIDDIILSSFNSEQGQMVNIELVSGVENVQVRHVEGNTVRVVRRVGTDEATEWTLTVDQLTAKEKMNRLRTLPGRDMNLIRGMIAWRAGDRASALDYFRGATGDPMAEALVDCLTQGSRQKAEGAARDDLNRLLQVAELPAATVFDQKTARTIRRRAYGEKSIGKIRSAASVFRKRHGATDIAKSADVVVAELERVDLVAREVDVGMIDDRVPRLKQANEGAGELRIERKVAASGAEINLSGNAGLTNIAALAGLPFVTIDISGCGVADLSPLRGMPLNQLKLGGCPVADLSPLKGAPLRVLDLSGTAVQGLDSLGGSPVQTLVLAGCEGIRDLSPLMALTRLQTLILPSAAVPADAIRKHPSLKLVGVAPNAPVPVAQFWAEREAQGGGTRPNPQP